MASNGTGAEVEIFSGFSSPVPYFSTPQSDLILHTASPIQIFEYAMKDGGNETTLRNLNLSPSVNRDARLSLDKKWLLYTSDETGRSEIYARPYPEVTAGKWQVSRNGGQYPLWNDAQSEVFWYDNENRVIMRSGFRTDATPSGSEVIVFSNPSELFALDASIQATQTFYPWDFRPSTQEFVFVRDLETVDANSIEGQTMVSVVEDWWAELNGLAPHQETP